MWSKLANNLPNLFGNKQSKNSKQIIDLAIAEIEEAILKNQKSLEKTIRNQRNIGAKLNQYQQDANELYQQAMEAVKRKRDKQAKTLLERKAFIDKQVEQYNGLYKNVSLTVRQLEDQIAKLKLRIEETRSKEVILEAKLQSAQTQQELNQYLSELDDTGHLDLYEQEVSKIEIQNNLTDDLLNLDQEFEELSSSDSLQQVKSDLEAEETAQKEEKLANQLKRVEQIFSEDVEKEKKQYEIQKKAFQEKQQKLIQELLQSNHEQKSVKDSVLEDFFNTPKAEEKTETPEDSLLEDFFKKDPKKQQIDDFFKNS